MPHRQEVIFSNKKIICVNDSKATSFDACAQSLANYDKIYWIVGGLPKHKDIFNLKDVKKRIIKAYIVGNKTNFFKQKIKNNVQYQISKNLNNALKNICNDLILDKNVKKTGKGPG